MISAELTRCSRLAPTPEVAGRHRPTAGLRPLLLALAGVGALGGCVQVTAPDKPIVIELNVNIRQEVIYRLAADADSTITDNKDIF